MPAVTLDLWHTLLFVSPEAEEQYMTAQISVARRELSRSPRRSGAPDLSDEELARAFELEYAAAVDRAGQGQTVTPAEQFRRAAAVTGRAVEVSRYLEGLEHEVRKVPFQRAPGALELLELLRNEGYGVAVISNTVGEPGAYLRPVLRRMGFDPFVESFVFSDEHPWTKPAPELFRTALDDLGETPGRAVHVGDGWSDIEGARRAGFRAGILFTGLQQYGARYRRLFLPDGWDRPHADRTTDRLEDVARIVQELLPVSPPAAPGG